MKQIGIDNKFMNELINYKYYWPDKIEYERRAIISSFMVTTSDE